MASRAKFLFIEFGFLCLDLFQSMLTKITFAAAVLCSSGPVPCSVAADDVTDLDHADDIAFLVECSVVGCPPVALDARLSWARSGEHQGEYFTFPAPPPGVLQLPGLLTALPAGITHLAGYVAGTAAAVDAVQPQLHTAAAQALNPANTRKILTRL